MGLSSDFDLRDEVIVITGASRGLGAGMAGWLVNRGARLGLCSRRMPAVSEGFADRVVAASVDVSDPAPVETFAGSVMDRFGPPTLWVNNAGVLEPIVKVRDLDYEGLLEHLAINVGGVLNGTRAFLRLLESSGSRGTLVNISSGAAREGRPGWAAYCAGKAAVDRITETVALEEGEHFRLALAVSPGLVDTDMQALIRQQSEDVQPDVEWFRERHREGELSSPAWVAENILKWHLGIERPESVICRVPPEPANHAPGPDASLFADD